MCGVPDPTFGSQNGPLKIVEFRQRADGRMQSGTA